MLGVDRPLSRSVGFGYDADTGSTAGMDRTEVTVGAPYVYLTKDELGQLLGLSPEEVGTRLQERLAQGKWNLLAACPGEPERLVMTMAALDEELEGRQSDPPGSNGMYSDGNRSSSGRVQELTSLLRDANRALLKAKTELRERDELRDKLAETKAAVERLSNSLVEAKRALVGSYDKILDLQEKLLSARAGIAASEEAYEAIDGISSILAKLRGKSTEQG